MGTRSVVMASTNPFLRSSCAKGSVTRAAERDGALAWGGRPRFPLQKRTHREGAAPLPGFKNYLGWPFAACKGRFCNETQPRFAGAESGGAPRLPARQRAGRPALSPPPVRV